MKLIRLKRYLERTHESFKTWLGLLVTAFGYIGSLWFVMGFCAATALDLGSLPSETFDSVMRTPGIWMFTPFPGLAMMLLAVLLAGVIQLPKLLAGLIKEEPPRTAPRSQRYTKIRRS